MREIGFRKMNWFPKETAWNQAIAQRAKRREMMDGYRQDTQVLAGSFGAAFSHQIRAVGEVTAQLVQARLQKDFDERRAQMHASYQNVVNRIA